MIEKGILVYKIIELIRQDEGITGQRSNRFQFESDERNDIIVSQEQIINRSTYEY